MGRPGAVAQESLLELVTVTKEWPARLAAELTRASTSDDIDAAVERWAEDIRGDAKAARVLFESSLRLEMAGRLMVLDIEVPEVKQRTRVHRRDLAFLQLPFADAIASFEERQTVDPEEFRQLRDRYKEGAFTATHLAGDALRDRARAAILASLESGETLDDTIARIRDAEISLGIDPASHDYLDNVVRTNVATAYGAGRLSAMTSEAVLEARPLWIYYSARDSRVRASHLALDGHVFEAASEVAYYYSPPLGFRCFPGDTLVQGTFEAGLRVLYDGEIVEITTEHGRRLSVTPNHPIATVNGFAPAGSVREGDQLFCYEAPVQCDHAAAPERARVDEQDAPLPIEQVFGALADTGRRLSHTTPDDLHGDAQFTTGDIEIVGANRVLPLGREPGAGENGGNRVLSATDATSSVSDEHRDSALSNDLGRVDTDASSGPSGTALPLDSSTVFLERRPLEQFRIGPASRLHVSRFDDATNRRPRDAEFFRELQFGNASLVASNEGAVVDVKTTLPNLQDDASGNEGALHAQVAADVVGNPQRRLPGTVTTDHVISIKRRKFLGHVYDLQSPYGWIVAGDIVTSNCRCSFSTLTDRDALDRGLTVTRERIPGIDPDVGFEGRPGPLSFS